MRRHKFLPILFLCLLFCPVILFSQLQVSPTSGCMPQGLLNCNMNLNVPGATNVTFNFGDGSPVFSVNPAVHSYYNIGSYTITCNATVNGSAVTYTALVTVNPQPTGNFSANVPSSHCAPMLVTFAGTSPNPGVTFSWDFGNNSIGGGQNTSHAYGPGTFTPILTIQDQSGCYLNVVGSPINVSSQPVISVLSSAGNFACSNSHNTSFNAGGTTSGSPLTQALTYNWNFGNGNTGTGPTSGNQLYTPQGTYNVQLTVTDDNSCSSTTVFPVVLLQPTVAVTVPGTVCVAPQMPPSAAWPMFTVSANSSQNQVLWDMGDGSILSFPPPTPTNPQGTMTPGTATTRTFHTYTTPGLKLLTITASAGTCIATTNAQIFVEEITPDFIGQPPSFSCTNSIVASYSNQSITNTSHALNYTWTVNHWQSPATSSLTSVNPSFTLYQGSMNPYTIYTKYLINASLLVESQAPIYKCLATLEKIVDTIQRPTAYFHVDKNKGCSPLTVTFMDSSFFYVNQTYTNSITNYTWYSGAGPSATLAGVVAPPPASNSFIPNFVFTYSPGVYSPSLHIQTTNGCSDISFQHTITVVDPPAITFTPPTGPFCAGQPVQFFLGTSGNTGPVDHWYVNADGGFFSGCITDPSPTFKFTHVGTNTFAITAYKNGCRADTIPTITLDVIGPLVKAVWKPICLAAAAEFTYDINDATSATVNYGDGSGDIGLANLNGGVLNHTFPTSGQYTVTFRAFNTNNACPPFTHTLAVRVVELNAQIDFFEGDSVFCARELIAVTGTNSANYIKGGGKTFVYFFDDRPPEFTDQGIYFSSATFTLPGMHSATLIVKDLNGCVDYDVKQFRISQPVAQFTFNANPICYSSYPVQLVHQTAPGLDAIRNVQWNFGEGGPFGLPNTIITVTQSSAFSPTFAYLFPGQTQTFAVSYTVTNNQDCRDSIRHTLQVNNPQIQVSATRAGTCIPGGPMIFQGQGAPSHTSYQFNYGNLVTSTLTNWNSAGTHVHAYTYPSVGVYTPVVTLTDNAGCIKVATLLPVYIQASVTPNFTFFNTFEPDNPTSDFCMPVRLDVTSTTDSTQFPLQYNWHNGKQNIQWYTGPSFKSGATYTATGQYSYTLQVVTVPSGCTSEISKPFTINDPHVDFVITPDNTKETYCLNEPIYFKVTRAEGLSNGWDWDFGDGVLRGPYTSTLFQGTQSYENSYFPENTNGILKVQLVGKTNAIQCKDVKVRTLRIIRALPAFSRNNETAKIDTMHCLGPTEKFTNLSSTNGAGLTFTWNFGGTATSNEKDPSYQFLQPGMYPITLKVMETSNSCTASITKPMRIFPNPVPFIAIADTLVCPGQAFSVAISGTPGLSGPMIATLKTPDTFTYSIIQGDTLLIPSSASDSRRYDLSVSDNNGCEAGAAAFINVQEPPPSIATSTRVVIGQQISLSAPTGAYSYTWVPEQRHLSSTSIYNPVSSTTDNITYTVEVRDEPLHCFLRLSTFDIIVLPLTTVDVPSAFTPNGDGINDIVFPDGWGIRKLIYFRIFNRWGQMIFESNDLAVGWDGTYQGVPQNMETYVYQVEVETYVDANPKINKTGTVKLLR